MIHKINLRIFNFFLLFYYYSRQGIQNNNWNASPHFVSIFVEQSILLFFFFLIMYILPFPSRCLDVSARYYSDTPNLEQTYLVDLPVQAGLHKKGWKLRSPAKGLLLQLQLQMQFVGLKLPVSTNGSLPEMGLDVPFLVFPFFRQKRSSFQHATIIVYNTARGVIIFMISLYSPRQISSQ